MIERRTFTRVDYDADATLEYEGEEFPSRIVRLSLKGVLINTGASPRKRGKAVVRFSADIGDEPVTLHCSGRVIRADRRGVGIEFEGVDLDTFKQLRDIVAANSSDPGVIVEEFLDFICRWEKHAEAEGRPTPIPASCSPTGAPGAHPQERRSPNRRRSPCCLSAALRWLDGRDREELRTALRRFSVSGVVVSLLALYVAALSRSRRF